MQFPAHRIRDPIAAREWGRLALFLGLLVAGIVFLRWDARRADGDAARAQLEAQLRAADENLTRQLEGADAALRAVARRVDAGGLAPGDATVVRELQTLSEALPGIGTLLVLDRDGRAWLSNRSDLIGQDFAERVYFTRARDRSDPGVLMLSPPFRSVLGVYSMNLSVSLRDAEGGFAGVVTASLDPDYFLTALRAALHAPDMWAGLAHGEGTLVMQVPPRPELAGTPLNRPGSMFERHRASGQSSTFFVGRLAATGEQRMIAHRTLQPTTLAMDHGIVLALTRDADAVYAAWRDTTASYALLLLLLALVSGFGLDALQRRRAAAEAVRHEAATRAAADAQRLALALEGADLALWELDVEHARCTVSPRWLAMLGLPPDADDAVTEAGWLALVHPEDRERVHALQKRHIAGLVPAYEATYRMRHAEGHWIWVQARGRVVERDADGGARRMVGTHLDVTERLRAQEALQRSEQDLAITLHSIGDAVVATDADGQVTRLNAAAERLTGWPAAEATGRRLAEVFRIFDATTRRPATDPVQQVLASGEVVGLANDTLLVARDGREFQIADSAAPIRRGDGSIAGVVMVFSDVTERYRAQQALRDREHQLSAIADALPGPVSRVDRDGRYLFANAAYERWFGLPRDQVLGRTQRELLGAHYAGVAHHVARALQGETVHYETPVHLNGLHHHMLVTLVPDRDEQGRVVGHFTIAADITERKQAEDALRTSERRTRALLDTLAAGVVVHAADTRIVDSNPAATEILGLSPDQLQGRAAVDPAWHFVEADGTPMVPQRYPVAQVLAAGEPLRHFMGGVVRPDRAEITWVLVDAVPVADASGRIEQVVVSFVDISDRMRAESSLRLLEAAVARLNDIVVITEAPQGGAPARIVYVNDAFERVTGYTRAEALGRSPGFLQGAETDAAEAERVGAAARAHQPVQAELLNYTRDGRPYWVEIDIVPLADGHGRVTHMVAVQRDVTERRSAQQRLQAAQGELAATIAAIPDLLFEITLDGRVERVHASRGELLVVPAAQQTGRTVDELLPADAASVLKAAVQAAHRSGFSSGHQYRVDLPGGTHWFEVSVATKPVAAGETPRFVLLSRDVTDRQRAEAERRALEAQLRESQRLETIGALAGGIAHDFNNVVAGILGNAALVRQDLGQDHPALASLAQIERAGLRARALVRRILDQGRRTPVRFTDLALQRVIEEPVALLRSTLPAGVDMQLALGEAPVTVHGDATQLQQVVMNLCVNAIQALQPAGGRVDVSLQTDRRHAWIRVRDTGCGMDADTLAHAFDPLFTTKGEGTGLGLAVVKGIVEAHGGRITVESQRGAGSCFTVELPCADAEAGADEAGTPAVPACVGAGEQLLYVDDDEIMRQVVQRLLERAGWRVATAPDAASALTLLSQPGHGVQAVVSDMTMPPGISGLELCRIIARRHPGMPMLICSGHRTDELLAQAESVGIRQVLAKEELLDTLVAAVSAALASRA